MSHITDYIMYIVWWSIHDTQAKIMWVFCNSLLREGDRGTGGGRKEIETGSILVE